MPRSQVIEMLVFPVMLLVGGCGWLVMHSSHPLLASVGLLLLLVVPGRVQGWAFRNLYRGRRSRRTA